MTIRRNFAIEDKNLTGTTVVSSRLVDYSDFDLTLTTKPSGDIYKKVDAEAVKQSVKTIIQTNHGEKPFNPYFGANVRSLLFENNHPDVAFEIERDITLAIENFEPRAKIKEVFVDTTSDRHDVSVRVTFKVVSTEEIVVLNTSLTRIK